MIEPHNRRRDPFINYGAIGMIVVMVISAISFVAAVVIKALA